jgi:hypothetical protein
MSIKSESLKPATKALLRLEPGDYVDLHWPDGSVETVMVLLIETRTAKVARVERPTDEYDHCIDVSRAWLAPIKNV